MESGLEHCDTQTIVFRGFGHLRGAAFLLMRVSDPVQARRWLRAFAEEYVTTGAEEPERAAAQIAFSHAGLLALGLDEEVLGGFCLPFRVGMVERERVLGDSGENDPKKWIWGGPDDALHAVLLVYARAPGAGSGDAEHHAAARALAAKLAALTSDPGWTFEALAEPRVLDAGGGRKRFKEHFGFDDGIANPAIRGEKVDEHPSNAIAAGEIVLGYPDEAGFLTPGPQVSPGGSGGAVLPKGEFGRNGSYLVMRQLEQKPAEFWRFAFDRPEGGGESEERGPDEADSEDRGPDEAESEGRGPEEAVHVASKMVGRWPNGAPLAMWPDREPESPHGTADDFGYADDRRGLACPLGAHARRSNPRDAVPLLDDPAEAIEASKRRRLLRRGRTYGDPLPGWPDPKAMSQGHDEPGRGLHFLCLCADIDRQFEFVQQSWLNSRKFDGLGNDADPLLSNPQPPDESGPSDFTIQCEPLSRRIPKLPQFVIVRGGAYFFLPGKKALDYLAGLGPS